MKLQIYVFWEILFNFLFTAVVLSMIAFLAASVVATYRIPGAPPSLVIGYVPILIMYIFPYLLPMALLVGVVITYGRLSAENEITAIRASGVHLWNIFCPSLLVGLLVAALNVPLVNDVIPEFHYQKTEYLRKTSLKMIKGLSQNLNPSLHSINTQSFQLEWGGKDGLYFEDLYLFLKGFDGKGEKRLQADRGLIEFKGNDLVLTLFGSQSLLESKEEGIATDVRTDRITYRIPFEEILGRKRYKPIKDAQCSSTEIAVKLRRGRATKPARASYELQRRCATVFSGVLFAAIGVPIGIFLRRGTRLSAFVMAFLTVLGGYYPIVYFMEMMAKEEAISPTIAAWTANVVLAIVALILVRRLFRI